MCLYPKLIQNKKYTANKKNGGIIPPINDLRTLFVPRKCGNCIECRKQKSREWKVRLQEDIRTNTNGKFITLTFSTNELRKLTFKVRNYLSEEYKKINKLPLPDHEKKMKLQRIANKFEGYGLDNEIATHALRLFNERWRKKFKKAIRHWAITELGHEGTEHIHIHGIFWTDEPQTIINQIWGYGYTWRGQYVNDKTINYITKYVTKQDLSHKTYKSKILNSDGIGKNYTNTFNSKLNRFKPGETKETYTSRNGFEINLPIYWRNNIYTEEEREKLWIEKLNKETRYIMGNKIDVSKGYEEYDKTLKEYQETNIKLGYGNDSKNWELAEYEKARRIIIQQTRLMRNPSGGPSPGGQDLDILTILSKEHDQQLCKPPNGRQADGEAKLFIEE